MVFSVSEEVTVKEGGPRMIVTGYSSGMVECRWYDGFGVKREAFLENELVPGKERRVRDEAR
ncbi:YodC family protein [Salmonella enterica subsp. enterica serovar Agona]